MSSAEESRIEFTKRVFEAAGGTRALHQDLTNSGWISDSLTVHAVRKWKYRGMPGFYMFWAHQKYGVEFLEPPRVKTTFLKAIENDVTVLIQVDEQCFGEE